MIDNIPTLDVVPGYNLYISGFIALRRPRALANCRITHVVSVLDWHFGDDTPLLQGFKHLHIPVDDVDDENLIVWFPRSNAFIEEGLKSELPSRFQTTETTHNDSDVSPRGGAGPGVLVHCAMGKSRSSTVILAYLLWSTHRAHRESVAKHRSRMESTPNDQLNDNDSVPLHPHPLTVEEALMLLRRGRPIAEPNEGFMEQLYLYHDMGCPDTVESHRLYRRWMYKRSVAESLSVNQAPAIGDVQFEDEEEDEMTNATGNQSRHERKSDIGAGLDVKAPDGSGDELSSAITSNMSKSSASSSTSTHQPQSQSQIQLKCRKCRRLLARGQFIVDHQPPDTVYSSNPFPGYVNSTTSPSSSTTPPPTSTASLNPKCAHIFLHPLSWMRPALSSSAPPATSSTSPPSSSSSASTISTSPTASRQPHLTTAPDAPSSDPPPPSLEGRLTCPNAKCSANIGKYAWQGLRCSCGGWETPAFALTKSKVDVIGGVGLRQGKEQEEGKGEGLRGQQIPIRSWQKDTGAKGKI